MKYIRTYESINSYQYIRYHITNFGDNVNSILRFDSITGDYIIYDLENKNFRGGNSSTLLKDFVYSDLVNEPGNFCRDATDEEIKQFEMAFITNKFNI